MTNSKTTPNQTETASHAAKESVTAATADIAMNPPPPSVTDHARALGSLPKDLFKGRRKHRRKWTGFIRGQRMWQGRAVILPNDEIGWIKLVRERVAVIRTARPNVENDGTFLHVCVPVEFVRLCKNPDAVALGALKRGVKERQSVIKAAAARENGKKPAGLGKRRGRPCKDGSSHVPGIGIKPSFGYYEPRWKFDARMSALAQAFKYLGFDDDDD